MPMLPVISSEHSGVPVPDRIEKPPEGREWTLGPNYRAPSMAPAEVESGPVIRAEKSVTVVEKEPFEARVREDTIRECAEWLESEYRWIDGLHSQTPADLLLSKLGSDAR